MKRIILLLYTLSFSAGVFAQQLDKDFFSNSQDFFSKYVYNGKVKYEAVKKDSVLVNKLIEQIGSYDLRIAGKYTRKAFCLNAYNILVIKSVSDNYPVESVLDIKGFFDQKTYTFAGEELTLNEIDKTKIGNEFDVDPRVHFWLNHAAIGDPELYKNAMMIYNINDLLDQQTKAALNNNDFIGVDTEGKEVLVPMLFKLNEKDFTSDGKTILEFINHYRKEKINPDFKISFYPCNYDLNDWDAKTKSLMDETQLLSQEEKGAVISKNVTEPVKEASELQPQDTTVISDHIKWSNDILSEGSYMIDSGFQVRTTGSLNTHHATYNKDLTRVNNDFRSTYFNLTVQGWNKISNRVNYGVQFTFRSFVISGFDSSPYEALSLSNNKSSKFYFRDISNSIKYLFHEGKWRVTGITSILVPASKSNFVKYKGDSLVDVGQTQWINQLFVNRYFSKYFTLNSELNSTYRFNASNSANKFIVRGSLLPEFNYWLSRSLRFYAFCELNAQLYQDFFSTFYFREGAGLTFVSGKVSQWDFQYFYNAVGKKSGAASAIIVGGRFNF
jgi:hypothetical protein